MLGEREDGTSEGKARRAAGVVRSGSPLTSLGRSSLVLLVHFYIITSKSHAQLALRPVRKPTMLVRSLYRSMVRPVSLIPRRNIATLEGNPHIVNPPSPHYPTP